MRDILRDTLDLWTTQEPFSGYKSQTIAWRLLPAIDNKRIRVYYRGDLCVGFVTWAWFLEKEFDTMKFNGAEVFARNDMLLEICGDIFPNYTQINQRLSRIGTSASHDGVGATHE